MKMNKFIHPASLALFSLIALLWGCGDSFLFHEEDLATLHQYIYVVSDRASGEPYEHTKYSKNVYLDIDETVRFWSVYAINGKMISASDADEYILGKEWNLEGNHYNSSYIRYSFSTAGKRNVVLSSTDYLNDVSSDTISVYVNTPVAIKLTQPENGYNQVDPNSPEGIHFSWEVSGVDEWETAVCYVYAALSPDEIWDSPLGYTECDDMPHIEGPLFPDLPGDSSTSVYWGVIVSNYTEDGLIERDTSKIFHFSTRFTSSKMAHVLIPILYEDAWDRNSVFTQIAIIDEDGDTVTTYTNSSRDTIFDYWTVPKKTLTFVIRDLRYDEYEKQVLTVDIPVATEIKTAPVIFRDETAPQVDVANHAFSSSDSIRFIVMDNGSGIDSKSIKIESARDSIGFSYNNHLLSFKNNCIFTCFASIHIQDNAQNSGPSVYWKIDPRLDSIYVSGPYSKAGDND